MPFVGNVRVLYQESHDLHPKIIVTINSDPAKFPRNVIDQWTNIFHHVNRRWRAATIVNWKVKAVSGSTHPRIVLRSHTIKDPVQRSAPVKMIIHKPYGKTKALMVLISPGAFSWNQGVALVLRAVPQAKASKHPAETELRKILSNRIFPFCSPSLATASKTSLGDKVSRRMITEQTQVLPFSQKTSQCKWRYYKLKM